MSLGVSPQKRATSKTARIIFRKLKIFLGRPQTNLVPTTSTHRDLKNVFRF